MSAALTKRLADNELSGEASKSQCITEWTLPWITESQTIPQNHWSQDFRPIEAGLVPVTPSSASSVSVATGHCGLQVI